MRDHTPISIDDFNGLWDRGADDSVPPDHFIDCNNVDYNESSVFARARFAQYAVFGANILRSYIFQTTVSGTPTTYVLVLTINDELYSLKISPTIAAPVLLIDFTTGGQVNDFACIAVNGRAYISPSNGIVGISTTAAPSRAILFVYDGTTINPAAGYPPTLNGPLTGTNSTIVGSVEAGLHYFSVVGETATGFLTPYTHAAATMTCAVTATASPRKVALTSILTNSGFFSPALVKRHIIATRVVPPSYVGSVFDLPFFFVPNATLNDDTTTILTVDFFDNQLVDDATYLLGLYKEIPAGAILDVFHNRLVLGATATNPSQLMISYPGDPESIDQVDGLLPIDIVNQTSIVDTAGTSIVTGISEVQEYRDVMYAWKINRTYAISDNGDIPATWPVITLDEGIGCLYHGVISVLDAHGVNVDYLLTCDKTGIYVFNGSYLKPELTWKIADLWKLLNKSYALSNQFRGVMHYCNDSVNKKVYITLDFANNANPTEILLMDYAAVDLNSGAFHKQVRFARWRFTGSGITPRSMVIYDKGTSVKLLVGDANFYDYNGTSNTLETLVAPYIQTYLVSDEELSTLHFGAVRVRTVGHSSGTTYTLTPYLYKQDLTTSIALPTMSVVGTIGSVQFSLANMVSQKGSLKLQAANNGYFDIGKIILFIKQLFTSVPG